MQRGNQEPGAGNPTGIPRGNHHCRSFLLISCSPPFRSACSQPFSSQSQAVSGAIGYLSGAPCSLRRISARPPVRASNRTTAALSAGHMKNEGTHQTGECPRNGLGRGQAPVFPVSGFVSALPSGAGFCLSSKR